MDSMASFDPYTSKTVRPFTQDSAKQILQGTPKDVAELARCREYSGLAGLEQLIRDTQDSPNLPIRCGWRYKKSPGSIASEVSQGALGTTRGPLDTTNPLDILGQGVEWIWNLNDAKKRILTDAAREGKTGEFLKISESISNGDFKGKFGIIAPYSKDFCKSCNRLRITAQGDLRLCLFGETGISLRALLQSDEQIPELKNLINNQLNFKKESHYLELGNTGITPLLASIGG